MTTPHVVDSRAERQVVDSSATKASRGKADDPSPPRGSDKSDADLYACATRIAHGALRHTSQQGVSNPAIYRASTVVFPDVRSLRSATENRWEDQQVYYGRYGTQTCFAFEEAVAYVEGAPCGLSAPSGVAAIVASVLALSNAGDRILVPNNVYEPVRALAGGLFARFGLQTHFYDPCADVSDIASSITRDTRILYVESPGSLTFEVQDLPALSKLAKQHDCLVIADNTWATPIACQPLSLGADISIHAATKYIAGHSDAMLGIILTRRELRMPVKKTLLALGYAVSPDNAFLGLRGLRSLKARLDRHCENGKALARWLEKREEVAEIWHPALSSHPQHHLFRRDFHSASGLFGGLLRQAPKQAVNAFFDRLRLFGMGYSWGGFESLILPTSPGSLRSNPRWRKVGQAFRISAGLEDPKDLIRDLENGFAAMAAVGT